MKTQYNQLNFNFDNQSKLNLKIDTLFNNIDELIREATPNLSKDDLYDLFIDEINQIIERDYYLIKDEQEFTLIEDLVLLNSQAEVDEIISGASLVKIKRKHLENLKEVVFAEYK